MQFSEVLNLIVSSCPFLTGNEYDGIIIKKLAATNTISDTGASHQSHMAFTGKQKDFFPFLNADGYFNVGYESKDDDLKKYFTLQIPLTIYKENTDALTNKLFNLIDYTSGKKVVKASVLRSRRNNADDQIELSIKTLDDKDFIEFRKLLRVDDFFVLLKKKNCLEYDLVGIRSNDKNAENLSKCTDFYKLPTQTPVGMENFKTSGKTIESIDKPHNRIIFGAPGTGKSNLLKGEQEKYFPNTNQQSEVSEEEIIRKELANIGNSYSKSFSLGFQYHEFFKDKKPKFIRETYGCNAEAAYITSQGARCVDFFNSLPDYSDSEITKEKIKEQLKKAEEQNYMKEAGSAAVGRKYSSYLYGKSISEICQELELVETHTQSRFIWYGVQSVDYTFEKETSEIIKLSERVTFHPNYSYAQFVGTYKPVQDSNDDEKIKYEYVPGPFMRVYVNAVKHPDRNFLLLIEEINRANVAAVFGDVFQLLDRKADDTSDYPITVSEDIKKYLTRNGINADELSIPSNMYIWATMNSADQGVLPMDAAFKRRWDFEYINIDDGAGELNGVTIPIPNGKKEDGSVKYESIEWNALRMAINEQLKKVSGVNEDKLLGPFFIGDETKISNAAQNPEQFCKSFKSKVLMYLFEDVVKMQPGELFETKDGSNIHYSDICKDFDSKGLKIFVKSICEQFPAFNDGDAE